jgi:hypothetical protein
MNNVPYGKEFHCIDCMFDPPNCSLCGRQSIPMALPPVEVFGKLILVLKTYYYNKKRQPWGHLICYEAFFFKDGEKILGEIGGSKNYYTYEKRLKRKKEMENFLKDNGYTNYIIQ